MLRSRIRQKLSRGETVLCAKAGYQDPEIVELMGTYGFDGVWICLEHRKLDPSMVGHLIRAARLGGMDAIIRTKPANYSDLIWLLEAGARAIMLPKVLTRKPPWSRTSTPSRPCPASTCFSSAPAT
jgi:2-keto-3-deoxy-L-rhamnonate aldolase RhmA